MQRGNIALPARIFAPLADLAQSRLVWCLIAVVFVATKNLLGESSTLGEKFGGPDDALRLVQVRDFLLHGYWYDTRIAQIGAPDVLNSHWSRLIDLPFALLISLLTAVLSYPIAEKAAHIVWPLALLLALLLIIVRETERRAGMLAGIVVVAFVAVSPTSTFQFVPGRIDHHNALILLTVAGTLLLQRAFIEARAGWAAGALFGASLAIGLEALPLIAAILGVAALVVCRVGASRDGVSRAIIACALTAIACFAVTTAPSAWADVVCDALSPNLLALIGSGAIAAAVLNWRFRNASPLVWLGGFAAAGVVGLATYGVADPACLKGAFGHVDPAVKTIWLDNVVEGRSLLSYLSDKPAFVVAYLATISLAVAAALTAWREDRSGASFFVVASTVLAALYGFYYVKLVPYGILLAIPVIACWIARLPDLGETPARTVRLGAIVLLNEATILLLATMVAAPLVDAEAAKKSLQPNVAGCRYRADLAALDRLDKGLILSNVDLGPFIAASSRHRAVAGPYHRLDKSIIATHEILTAQPPAGAQAKLKALGVDYVVLCLAKPDAEEGADENSADKAAKGEGKKSEAADFIDHLRGGGTLPFLAPVSIGEIKGKIGVWRVQ